MTWIRWKPNGVSTGSEISPFLSLKARLRELLDEAAVEREVIEVAAGAAGVGGVLRVLVRGRGERELVLEDLLADAASFCLTFSLSASLAFGSVFSRMWLARTWVPLNRSRLSLRNLRSVASVALRLVVLRPAETVLELLAQLVHRGAVLHQERGQVLLLALELVLDPVDLLVDLAGGDRDVHAGPGIDSGGPY